MRIWIDLDNAPHVLIFRPIISELKRRSHEVLITARDYGQTEGLLRLYDISHILIGEYSGKSKIRKAYGLTLRSFQLFNWARHHRIDMALSHGARASIIPAKALGIYLVIMYDYEFVFDVLYKHFADLLMIPDKIPDKRLLGLGVNLRKVIKYPGLKEEIYVDFENVDVNLPQKLGLDPDKVWITLRPPATTAHYHIKKSEEIFWKLLEFLLSKESVQIVLLPRTEAQKIEVMSKVHVDNKVIIPDHVVDGMSIIYHSDIVIGGGGTMTREAAVAGVPSYTIFQSRHGAVDEYLEGTGRLVYIRSKEDFEKIKLTKKEPIHFDKSRRDFLVNFIVDKLEEIHGRRR